MPVALRKAAPFLILAGVALSRRDARARPAPGAGQWAPRLSDRKEDDRSTTNPAETHDATRGRQADKPSQIPAKGWKDILIRTWKEFQDDQIPLVAAGVTFYALLALFPALAAFVALYGLFADVEEAQRHLSLLAVVLPPDAVKLLGEQMVRLARANEGGLSLAFAGGLLLSLWSANGAAKAIITALNIAYDEKERRKFIRKTATSLAFTLGAIAFGLGAIAVIAAPAALEPFVGETAAAAVALIGWPLLLAGLGLGLALLYRFGPSRDRVRWRWISWGSAAALVLWLIVAAAFSTYVANFANYDKTYGSLGAAIGFMMWVYFSAQAILLGAELNAEIEHQTAKDTTVGEPRPLGARGANMADTVGEPQ